MTTLAYVNCTSFSPIMTNDAWFHNLEIISNVLLDSGICILQKHYYFQPFSVIFHIKVVILFITYCLLNFSSVIIQLLFMISNDLIIRIVLFWTWTFLYVAIYLNRICGFFITNQNNISIFWLNCEFDKIITI